MDNEAPEASFSGSLRRGLSEMQVRSRLDGDDGSEAGFTSAGLCSLGELPVHRLATT